MSQLFGEYSLQEHLHQYAVWTAARAASISRFSNTEISGFIHAIELRKEVDQLANTQTLDRSYYRDWFTQITDKLLVLMNDDKVAGDKFRNISFGVAAKVISIYIKTYHILPNKGEGALSALAYPPIDSILLANKELAREVSIRTTTWSKFEKADYFEVLDKLETHTTGHPFWKLEAYWSSAKKKNGTKS